MPLPRVQFDGGVLVNAELAYGEKGRVAASAECVDRGKDWPLAAMFFSPVIAIYVAIGYGLFVAASQLP
jgi:hypothetical protein